MSDLRYDQAGVNYDLLDEFKRATQQAARQTACHLWSKDIKDFSWSRGESAHLMEGLYHCWAHVNEGLGTKTLVADALYHHSQVRSAHNPTYYDCLAIDTIASIINDLITSGALPLSVAMNLAVGSSSWFNNTHRWQDLIRGWQEGCHQAQCIWGGGETAVLKDIITPESCVLSGSAVGVVHPKTRLISQKIKHGDAIVLLASSGIHANGLTLARHLVTNLPNGYFTKLANGQTYGEALLEPSLIYVPVIKDCLDYFVPIHYAVHLTGHGWRKLMRATEPFVYVIEDCGTPPPIFDFMQQHGPITDREAYTTFNMGAGFALYVWPRDIEHVIHIAASHNIKAWYAGHVEKHEQDKKVVIVPKGLEYSAETLAIR